MWGSRLVGLVVVMVVLSGCAGLRPRQELARLQSQLQLLDERVTQLERSTIGSAFPEETFQPTGTGADTTLGAARPSVTPEQPTVTVGKKASASVKPTTREIQQALKNAGFYQGAIDGKTGPLTREAIKEFQRVHGLVDDGVVGKRTWAKLKAYADLSADSGELNAAEILK